MTPKLIRWRNKLLLLVLAILTTHSIFAQTTVTGKVTDERGAPLEGATIQQKGTPLNTVTKKDGTFSLAGVTASSVIVTFVGYETKEVTLTGQALSISMELSASALQDVVVVGYGSRRKGDVTGAVASVSEVKIREVPTTNITQALQGRIPGLVATPSSFRPGSGGTIRIRGNRSLVATNDPLVVVDGIPIASSIDDLNPLDIESIDVLKDASATAIYGSRGANGVIQVTTKKGKAGKVTVEYDGKVSFDNLIRPLTVFNPGEFAEMRRQAYFASRSYNTSLSAATPANPNYYFPDPRIDSVLFGARLDYYTWQNVANGYTWIDRSRNIAAKRATTEEEKTQLKNLGLAILDSVAIYDPSKVTGYNWQNNGLETGITNNHNITVRGGTDKFKGSFSGGYFSQKGIETGQDYTRYSFNLSTDVKPHEYVNFGGGVLYSFAIQNTGATVYRGASGQLPIAQPYDSTGTFLLTPGNDANIVNPLNDVNTIINETRINRVIPNVFGEVQLLKGLKLRAAANIDMSSVIIGGFNGSVSSSRAGGTATASYTTRNYFTWSAQNFLTYDTRIGAKHSLNAMVGQEFVKNRFEEQAVSADQLIYESQKWHSLQNNSATTPNQAQGQFTESQNWSYFGRINYGYDDRYLVTFNVRDDWSSVLPAGNQHQVFPSGAVSWRINQEKFMASVSWIDNLKLRLGYGQVGNAGISPYLAGGTLTRTPYNYGPGAAQGYAPSTLPLDITWEKTNSANLGIDFGFLKNRINGTIDLYQTKSNQILSKRLPSTSGFSSVQVNVGEVENKGIELSLSTLNIAKPDFSWSTDIIFGVNKESINRLETKADNIASQWFIGQPLSVYYDYKFMGVFQYADTVKGGILKDYFWTKPGNRTNAAYQPGRAYVADLNGDTAITELDKIVLGSHNPKWTASISNTFTYKDFELNVFIYARQGSLIREMRPNLNGRYQSYKVDYWSPTNPSNQYAQPNNTIDIQQYWQAMGFRDGSFVRVRNISLTYRLPRKLLDHWKIPSLSAYVNVLNPFLFSEYKTADPETVPYLSSYPTSSTSGPGPSSFNYRSFLVGVRLGL